MMKTWPTPTTNLYLYNLQGDDEYLDREVADVTGQDEEDMPTPRSGKSEGTDLIHPNDVLKALRAFVEEHREPPK